MPKPRVIYWFRTDLRLHDSPALKAALDLDPEVLYPIWTWDPHYVYRARVGSNRWQFLLDCQSDLSKSITKLNPKSQLFLIREAPQTLFPKLFKEWNITHLVFEKDTDAYARDRDDKVMQLAKESGVEVIVKVGRTLYDPDELVKLNKGKPTMSISQVQAAGGKIGDIPKPIPAPKALPDPGDTDLNFDQEKPLDNPDLNANQRDAKEDSYSKLSGPMGDFAVPTMEELGLKPATTPHRGGETIALKMLDDIIADEDYTATFEKPKTAPTAFNPQSTTLLSPHLHFGSLSVREFYWRVEDVVQRNKKKASKPPTSLTGQLLFRDMYFGAQASLSYSFAQTYNNSHCRFIPWHLPSEIDTATNLSTGKYLVDDEKAEEYFTRWKQGRTGFPWIDALMRQLRQEGWIHHLGRHAVACFLTRGGCYIDWERGAEVFEEWLIDVRTIPSAPE
jgi:cryptochrome